MILGDLEVCYRNPRVLRILKAVAPVKAEKIGAKKARDDRKKEAIIKKCPMGEGCGCRLRLAAAKRKKDGGSHSLRSERGDSLEDSKKFENKSEKACIRKAELKGGRIARG